MTDFREEPLAAESQAPAVRVAWLSEMTEASTQLDRFLQDTKC